MINKEKVIKELGELCEYLFRDYKVCYHVDEEDAYNRFLIADNALDLLKEQEAREQCLKTKCVICPHCDHCDVDENGQLKEQEIKSMTLEELDEIYEKQDTHIWPFDTPPYLWMTVNPDVRLTDGFWICWRDVMYSIKNDSPFYVRENYGKAWLIWTGKPTQEQVQAVKWNG